MSNFVLDPVVVETVNEFEAPAEVLVWNYLDAEHLPFIHKNYESPQIFVRHGDTTLFLSRLKVPGLPIFFRTSNLVFLPTFGAQTTITISSIALIRTEIHFTPISESRTQVHTKYMWYIKPFLRPFAPLLRRKVLQWSKQVNEEDRPLRQRRAFVMSHGFRDFHGMTGSTSNQRRILSFPAQIPYDSPIFAGCFSITSKRRVTLNFSDQTVRTTDPKVPPLNGPKVI